MSYFTEDAWQMAMDNMSLYADESDEVYVEVDNVPILERLDGLRKAVEAIPPAPPPPQFPEFPTIPPFPDNAGLLKRLIGEVGSLKEALKPKPVPPLRFPAPKQTVKRVIRDEDGLIQAIVED